MSPARRVGLNLVSIGDRAGGIGRYARALVGGLLEARPELELTLFVSRDAPADLRRERWAAAVRWVTLPCGSSGPMSLLAQQTLLPALAAARRLHIVHSPSGVGPAVVPGARRVVTLHDVVWLLLPDEVAMTPRERAAWARATRLSTRGGARVIADSQAGCDDILSAYCLDRDRVSVVPLGTAMEPPAPSSVDVRARHALGDSPLLLAVGQQQPYKGHAQLLRALPALSEAVAVVVGAPTVHTPELARLADDLGVAERVRLLGWVAEDELQALYAAAAALVLPSRMEGFGLPVLEGFRRGVPVVCSDRSALPEVAGDAALTFDPGDPAALAATVRRLLDDDALRSDLVARGNQRLRAFTWAACAEGTLGVYDAALGG